MTAPSHLKNENNWQMVSSRSGIFLNCVGTIDGKHIDIRKCASSGSIQVLFTIWERLDTDIPSGKLHTASEAYAKLRYGLHDCVPNR